MAKTEKEKGREESEEFFLRKELGIRPAWHTFASSVSGVWKGVGAVCSSATAEMEPMGIGSKNKNLCDCYTLSHIKALPSTSGDLNSQIQRKINWIIPSETQNNQEVM